MFVDTVKLFRCQTYHIAHGTPDNGRFCPLALTITAQWKGVAIVGLDGAVEIREMRWEFVDKVTGTTRRRFKFGVETVIQRGRIDAIGLAWMKDYDQTGRGLPVDFLVTFQ